MGWPGPVTQRQLDTWMWWFREELDRPNRTDNYLMQISADIVNKDRKSGRVKVSDRKLKFGTKEPLYPELRLTKEKIAEMNRITAEYQLLKGSKGRK